MRILITVMCVAAVACGDDGVHHLADAPPMTIVDGPSIDALPAQIELAVTLAGTGSGTITSSPDGIACGATCTSGYAPDTIVTLTAVPATGSVFTAWGGACSGTTPTCDFKIADATAVTATFDKATYTVTVTKAGAGSGTVAGGAVDCGSACTVTVDHGTTLTLAATAATLSTFAGWGGACSGTAACDLTITADTVVSANFALDDVTLFVTRSGTGAGTVTATGISCGADCQETYTANQMVTLSAAAATGSTFTGWSGGGCSGTGTCTVTMTAATTVTAAFALQTFMLSVATAGSGTVTGGGINCGTACSGTYDYNTSVTLTATAGSGSTFTTWGGACTGTGPCTVLMTTARAVTATFTANVALTVTRSGTGTGTVTGGAINCGSTCSQGVAPGTKITLTATPSAANSTLSTFDGWSGGGCTGTGTCTVTVSAATTVNAAFTLKPNLIFVSSSTSNGTLGGLAGADTTCNNLAAGKGLPGKYVAYLSATNPVINAPSRVGTATGWVRVDGKPVMNTINQLAAGSLFAPVLLMEDGTSVTTTQFSFAWTGTDKSGSFANSCLPAGAVASWQGPTSNAYVGNATSATNAVQTTTSTCDVPQRLYCLGIDRAAIAQ